MRGPRSVRSTCNQHVEQPIRLETSLSRQIALSESRRVPACDGSCLRSASVIVAFCLNRMLRLGLGSESSGFSTRSPSHWHGRELRLEIIHGLRNRPVLRKFSSFSQNLPGKKPVNNRKRSPTLIVDRYHQVYT